MKIGIDIDDTITETYNNILPFLCKYYNLDIKEVEKDKYLNYNSPSNLTNYEEFAKANYPFIIPYLPLQKDAKKYINKLKETNEIYFITARSSLGINETYRCSYEYLKNNGILFDKLYVGINDKAKLCDELKIDYFIDDNITNCLKVNNLNKTKVILFGNKYNITKEALKRIDNWEEIYNYITKG